MDKVYDLLILGAGPAGITAAVYAARKGMDLAVVTVDIGGQAALSSDIENYTGYQFITGADLTAKFNEHMNSFGIDINSSCRVKEINKIDNLLSVVTDKERFISKTIIIATGKRPKKLGVLGEEKFKNKGVTYCATCDGPIFKDKAVAIIGGGNSALDAALQMAKIASHVYVINMGPELKSDYMMVERIYQYANVEILNNTVLKEIVGDIFVKKIVVEKNDQSFDLSVDGVFIEIGLIPNTEFTDMVDKNEFGEIVVNSQNMTNVDGVFAAGDVTDILEKQIIVACGEGAKAALSAFKYISRTKF